MSNFSQRPKKESRPVHPLIGESYERYLNSLLNGERQVCLGIVRDLLDHEVPLKDIYLGLFERSMYQVGELWETNAISVSTEHIATAVTESAMTLLHPLIFATEHCGRKAIVSCVANEYHQIGGKMVADIFEFHGWDGYFLGANTPANALVEMVAAKQPDVVCLSLTLYSNLPDLFRHVRTLHERFPDTRVIVGGQALRWGGHDVLTSLPKVRLIYSLDELEEFIRSYGEGTE
jgi:methanogenic corrinoid protein MtbC1